MDKRLVSALLSANGNVRTDFAAVAARAPAATPSPDHVHESAPRKANDSCVMTLACAGSARPVKASGI